MLTRIGICSLLAGFFLGIFAGISGFMQADNIWVNLTISKLLGENKTESIITSIDVMAIQDALDFFMYDLPLFGLLIGLGVLFLTIGLFVKSH